jgi:uncharacterized protein
LIQPHELKLNLPIKLSNGTVATTTRVWEMLVASKDGDLKTVQSLAKECPELIYAQYNYTPPIHFAVREGHLELVKYLLNHGAHDPAYRTYPFHDGLITIAVERGYTDIALLLEEYASQSTPHKYKGDNGEIIYDRTADELEFQKMVNNGDVFLAEELLKTNPQMASDETYFWGEGILLMPVKSGNQKMIDLLMRYGAKVPSVLKWAQFYYFERYDNAIMMMEKGMDPNTMSWHHVTLLHDMAQKGNIPKAQLLIKHGAELNPVEEEYQSTPLGMAARWGQTEMVEFLLKQGADPNKSGAAWSTPLAWAEKKGYLTIENMLREAGAE